jgi:hypothetical protein
VDARDGRDRGRAVLEAGQEAGGLLGPPLGEPELGQLGQRLGEQRRLGAAGALDRVLELALGLGPAPGRHEHVARVQAADGEDVR